jgi:orotate phosphoribosyltransferase
LRDFAAMTSAYKNEFIDLCLRLGVLKFGSFKLKSGRESPYFFNAGLFSSGAAIAAVGRAYADAIVASDISFDMLFGPAYKGIPLVTDRAAALADHHGIEPAVRVQPQGVKDHGEGGNIVGSPLRRAGPDRRRRDHGGNRDPRVDRHHPCGRRSPPASCWPWTGRNAARQPLSAVQEVGVQFGIPVVAIINLAT